MSRRYSDGRIQFDETVMVVEAIQMEQSAGKAANSGTLIDAVMANIRQRIAARNLVPGAKLPSVRALAKSMQVSTSTVIEAYDRLVADGTLRSRPGSGFYVAGALAPLSLAAIEPRPDRAVDPLWVSRQALDDTPGFAKPGCGWLPPSWLPQAALRRAARGIARADASMLTDYASPMGLAPLRQLLSRRLENHGVQAGAHQIILTESGTQAIDLLCRFLLQPGDTVIVDDPCYFNFHALLKAHRVKTVSVPYTASGPDLVLFEQALLEHQPRLYITNSAVHNPTGASLSPVTAHRVLLLAERAGLAIIEDDIFADFETHPSPRLAAFDGLNRVVQIGSFSKTLSASVRCGFIAAPEVWVEPLIDLKIATSFGGGHFSEALVLSLLKDGSYRKHVEALRQRLAVTMAEVITSLKALGCTPWIEPNAGMFLWCRLPDGVDAAELAKRALTQQVVLAPGNVFSSSEKAAGFMRFNVAQMSDPKTMPVLQQALQG